MADAKISQLPSGGSAQSGDVFPVVRAGTDYQLSLSSVTALVVASVPAQVNADWNATSGPALILNKPASTSQVNADWNATSGIAQILNKPTIPAAQVQTDWNATSGLGVLLNKPAFAAVATSGSYTDLSNKPTQVQTDWNATTGLAVLLNKPTIPAAQVNSDWNAVSGVALILNKPVLATTATATAHQWLSAYSATTGVFTLTQPAIADVSGLSAALALLAPLASPALTGVPTAPTAAVGTNTTQVATTAFVAAAVTASSSGLADPGSNGIVKRTSLGITAIALAADVNTTLGYTAANDALVAHLAGVETFSGAKTFSVAPIMVTAAALDNSTKGATTAYADSAVAVEKSRALSAEALLAPLNSPALTGNPTAPTQSSSDNSTKLATTAFVATAVAGVGLPSGAPNLVVATNPSGAITATAALRALVQQDIPALPESQITNLTSDLAAKAPLASPAFTGSPTTPTATVGDNSTKVASTAFVAAAIGTVNGLIPPTAFSATATVAASVTYGQCTGGTGGITLTLQSSLLAVGQRQRFMKMDSAAGVITLTDASSKTFNGQSGWAQSTWVLINQGQYVDLVWDGTLYTVFGN